MTFQERSRERERAQFVTNNRLPQPALLVDPEHQRSKMFSRSRVFRNASHDGLLLRGKRLTPYGPLNQLPGR